ncbi:hypothetical protein I4F81_011760 [Pyropia yezoensis]|uniref:Uncharacterized protein n=1 Tax=Pyropia yezoensis TaxID=2788 RepID=A0ACC3CGH5_PYRYE|nr:hypothetical protein I4F81_011760 [Neopyropia yezoensis]
MSLFMSATDSVALIHTRARAKSSAAEKDGPRIALLLPSAAMGAPRRRRRLRWEWYKMGRGVRRPVAGWKNVEGGRHWRDVPRAAGSPRCDLMGRRQFRVVKTTARILSRGCLHGRV